MAKPAKLLKLDAPVVNINTIVLGGEELVIPGRFDELIIDDDLDCLAIYLIDNEHDDAWKLANVEWNDLNCRVRYLHAIHDGLDVDQLIENVINMK